MRLPSPNTAAGATQGAKVSVYSMYVFYVLDTFVVAVLGLFLFFLLGEQEGSPSEEPQKTRGHHFRSPSRPRTPRLPSPRGQRAGDLEDRDNDGRDRALGARRREKWT